MVGAILSSFNSALNSTTTIFSLGIYKGVLNKEATEEQVVKSGKVFGWIMAVITMIIAPLLAGQESRRLFTDCRRLLCSTLHAASTDHA